MPTKKKNAGKYTLGQNRTPLHDVQLPSGATCQARRPGVQGFISAGVLDSFDSLTALVQTEHVDKNSSRPGAARVTAEQAQGAASAMLANKEKMEAGFQLIDRLVVYCITQPEVWIDYPLKNETEEQFAARQAKAEEDEALAVSDIDLEDRLFLMNWAVGGSADLQTFRQGLAGGMAGMAAIQSVQLPTE